MRSIAWFNFKQVLVEFLLTTTNQRIPKTIPGRYTKKNLQEIQLLHFQVPTLKHSTKGCYQERKNSILISSKGEIQLLHFRMALYRLTPSGDHLISNIATVCNIFDSSHLIQGSHISGLRISICYSSITLSITTW